MKRLAWGRIGCVVGLVVGFLLSEEAPPIAMVMIPTFVLAGVALHAIAVWRSTVRD